jgi:NAD(P)-dependent dehydrogenase (short-subunit alcohol dehydrogenase family)
MKGRVVVVTGGIRGIGRALAEGYVHAGAKVVVASRNPESCQETEQYLRSLDGEARGFPPTSATSKMSRGS